MINWLARFAWYNHSWVYTKGELKRECAFCGKIQHGMHTIKWH